MQKEKNKGGRPSKIGKVLIKAFEDVLKDYNLIILTDDELVSAINFRIKEKDMHISKSMFKYIKKHEIPENCELTEEELDRFLSLVDETLLKEKQNLLNGIKNTEINSWQRYAFLLERKWSEWNLKQVQEIEHKVSDEIKIQYKK